MENKDRLLFIVFISIFFSLCCGRNIKISKNEYLEQRSAFISHEWSRRTGGSVELNPEEQKVNKTLMRWKLKEMEMGEAINGTFPPAIHFLKAKQYIEESLVFQLIRKMPKGAALHVHDSAMANLQWVVKNATYDKNCYMCFNKRNLLLFHFFEQPPSDGDCDWSSVPKMRMQSGDPVKFDKQLLQNLTLLVDDPVTAYPNSDAAWKRFQSLFESLGGLVFYVPVTRGLTLEALRQYYEDNVQYVEMRGLLPPVYELNGTVQGKESLLHIYQDASNQFVKEHSDFVGLRVIPTSSRSSSNLSTIRADITEVIDLRKKFPGFVVGYDIVGNEDHGGSLLSYLDALLYPSQAGIDLPYFFHAGETDLEGSSVDLNLVDAVLLNATRIGHGFAITKHPNVLEMIKKKNIPLEVCPISNQVLGFVKDLRNHPAAALMASGYPLVISGDDPGLWNATGLSYDFYEAFMGIGGSWADLATLKQLAMDSIRYSGLSAVEKKSALNMWQEKWNNFIHQAAETFAV